MNYAGDGIDVAGFAKITNAGLIQGVRSAGINNTGRGNYSEGLDIGGGTVVNSGTIEGGSIAVRADTDADITKVGFPCRLYLPCLTFHLSVEHR